jgi:SRSO17 transposase
VHLSYAAPGFQCLLDSRLYLPKTWTDDPQRRKKTTFPTKWSFTRNRKSPWD